MNIKEFFKGKRKKEVNIEKALPLIVDYIKELEKNKYSEDEIMQQLIKRGYSDELILEAFELNLKKEVKMAKKKEVEEDFEEEEEDELEEEEEEEEDEEEVEEPVKVKPKKTKKVTKESKEVKTEATGPTLDDILVNFEQRIANLEAKLFRMLNA